jgi:hypothetical protein
LREIRLNGSGACRERIETGAAAGGPVSHLKSEPIMSSIPLPFSIPANLPLVFRRVLDYWDGLKRGENSMPFWDDLKLTSLPDLSDCLMLVDTFENPQRFRLNSVGAQIRQRYGTDLAGKFVDEISPKVPFEFLTAQASATVEAKAPTFFAAAAGTASGPHHGYARLLLPMWGEGRIGLMLGAIEDLA